MSCCLEIYDHYSFDEFNSTIVFLSINRRSRIIKRYTTLIAVYQSQMRSNRKIFSNNNLQISSPYVLLLLMCIISSWDNNCFRLFCNFQQFLHTKCNKRFSFNLFCMKIISMWNENFKRKCKIMKTEKRIMSW